MTDQEKIAALVDALRQTRAALLIVLSPAISKQLSPERRAQAHGAIDMAQGVIFGCDLAKAQPPEDDA